MRAVVALSLTSVLAWSCVNSSSQPPAPPTRVAPLPDASLGLAKASVFDVPTPPPVKANETAPGEKPALPRPYVIAPPRIPHAVGDFLPITAKQNSCVDCHSVTEKKSGEPTPMPASHYVDYRNTPHQVGDQVAGARYVCISCHVVVTDAPSLVENRFRP